MATAALQQVLQRGWYSRSCVLGRTGRRPRHHPTCRTRIASVLRCFSVRDIRCCAWCRHSHGAPAFASIFASVSRTFSQVPRRPRVVRFRGVARQLPLMINPREGVDSPRSTPEVPSIMAQKSALLHGSSASSPDGQDLARQGCQNVERARSPQPRCQPHASERNTPALRPLAIQYQVDGIAYPNNR